MQHGQNPRRNKKVSRTVTAFYLTELEFPHNVDSVITEYLEIEDQYNE